MIGPFTISLVQMLVVTLWVGLSLALWNSLVKSGSDKLVAAVITSPIALVFGIIAFFEISELPLIPFVTKMIQTYIIDEPIKFQIMTYKYDPVEIHLKQLSKLDAQQRTTDTKSIIDLDKWEQIEKKDIL